MLPIPCGLVNIFQSSFFFNLSLSLTKPILLLKPQKAEQLKQRENMLFY